MQSTHQVDMKNVVECPGEFFAYFNALETTSVYINRVDRNAILKFMFSKDTDKNSVKSPSWFEFYKVNIYIDRDIKPPSYQFCFPQFFPRTFLSWKRKQTFHWSKNLFWTNKKFVFFSFSTAQTGGNKIGSLVVWCHDQEKRLLCKIQINWEILPNFCFLRKHEL